MSEARDQEFLRRAIALSEAAVAHGGRPFGTVVCHGPAPTTLVDD